MNTCDKKFLARLQEHRAVCPGRFDASPSLLVFSPSLLVFSCLIKSISSTGHLMVKLILVFLFYWIHFFYSAGS